MVKFSIGASLIILSLMIGLSQYFDNKAKIQGAETRLERTKQQVREMGQFSQRLEAAKKLAMPKGNDQRARLESSLGLAEMGLDLTFTSSPRPDSPDLQTIYRHEYQISGQATFFDAFNLLNTLENTPGFIVNYVCFKCKNINIQDPEEGKSPMAIRGFLNVYNPEKV